MPTIPSCTHPVLRVVGWNDLGAHCSCLFCEEEISIPSLKNWASFESTEAPSWDDHLRRKDRPILLVHRRFI